MKVQRVIALLEIVQLLNHRDGNHDIMLVELMDAVAVVKDDVGVEDKNFSGGCHSPAFPCGLIDFRVR
jgi:hypothetical protein